MREAVIRLPRDRIDRMGLAEFFTLCDEYGLRDVTELTCRSDGCLLVATLADPIPPARLEGLDELVWWEELSGAGGGATYLVKATAGDQDVLAMPELGISDSEIRVGEDSLEITLVGSQADIARGIGAYEDAGLRVLLDRMGDYDGPSSALDALTDRQREVLEAGHDLGYFEVPRQTSVAEVADELGLDTSTVGEHLQRAERNLMSALFAAG